MCAVSCLFSKDWEKYVRHAEGIHKEEFVEECGTSSIIVPVVINLRDSNSSNSVGRRS
jgi:hypothetical protein